MKVLYHASQYLTEEQTSLHMTLKSMSLELSLFSCYEEIPFKKRLVLPTKKKNPYAVRSIGKNKTNNSHGPCATRQDLHLQCYFCPLICQTKTFGLWSKMQHWWMHCHWASYSLCWLLGHVIVRALSLSNSDVSSCLTKSAIWMSGLV